MLNGVIRAYQKENRYLMSLALAIGYHSENCASLVRNSLASDNWTGRRPLKFYVCYKMLRKSGKKDANSIPSPMLAKDTFKKVYYTMPDLPNLFT